MGKEKKGKEFAALVADKIIKEEKDCDARINGEARVKFLWGNQPL